MKKLKLLLTVLICLVLVGAMFAGCGKDADTSEQQPADNSGAAENAEAADVEEEPYEIVMEIVNLGNDFSSIPLIEERINAITLPEINATVKLFPLHIKDHANKLSLMVAGGDKIDLVMTGITTPLAGLVSTNAVMPLDDLLDRVPGLVEKQGELLEAFRINGKIYSVAGDLYPAKAGGILYNKDMADAYGIEVPERVTLEELAAMGETLKENGIYLTTPGDGVVNSYGNYYPVSNFSGDYAYGVIFDPVNNTEIENFYASDEFKEYSKRNKEWYENGYVPSDALVSGKTGQALFRAEETFYLWTNLNPAEKPAYANQYDFNVGFAQCTDALLTTWGVQEFAYGIPTHCERPEAVMDFLELIFTNAEISNLLNSGIEGVDYQKVSENIVTFADGIDYSNAGYFRIFNKFGDPLQTYQWAPATEDYYDELIEFNNSADKYKTLGYVFDAEAVATEVATVNSVVAEYRPPLIAGAVDDVDAAIEEFVNALEAAGIEAIIEENQRQMEAYLANQQ